MNFSRIGISYKSDDESVFPFVWEKLISPVMIMSQRLGSVASLRS